MPCYICITCGNEHAESEQPPDRCAICDDERQYLGLSGQKWTTIEALAETHEVVLREEEPALWSVELQPSFAIGQRALLVVHPQGNVLWDCVSLVDEGALEAIGELGGLAAIAISHPHFYASMAEWSVAFGGVPVYLHQADAAHLRRPDPCVTFWAGDTYPVVDGVTLIWTGGHFEGSSLLHWAAGADGKGVLLASDTVKVGWDCKSVSVMRSYPNLIPVGPTALDQVEARLAPLAYDRIYAAWPGHHILEGAPGVVKQSLTRYRQQIAL
jgi:glyoxylase-like metal-dependent hydrolase (beta-lactamase superfamily II)